MEPPLISPQQIDAELGMELAPAWMGGQNICNLRDMAWENVAANRRMVLHLIREAHRMEILAYDQRGIWSLNSNFGDIMNWLPRWYAIQEVIREAGNSLV